MILAGDVGGTKTNLALFEREGDGVGKLFAEETYASSDFDSFESILATFRSKHSVDLTRACVGVAGPVVEREVRAMNLPWVVSERVLGEQLGLDGARVVNDLEATAYGIDALGDDQFVTLSEGEPKQNGNLALIAAGTGLGLAGILMHRGHYHPVPCEGGHSDLPARTPLELELVDYLAKKYGGHVSCERALSGPGLRNIYEFLRQRSFWDEADVLTSVSGDDDPSALISAAAWDGSSEVAAKALDMFTTFYGAIAGNIALMFVATAGVYVGGGIAPKIIEKLKDGAFMQAFRAKGRMSDFVSAIPVRVILDEKTALYGAARRALTQ